MEDGRAGTSSRRRSRWRRRPARAGQQVAVIGYPARDSRVPDDQLMQSIFGDVYDKKRLAPGQVTEARPDVLLHDCSTLGGNSGSVLVDLATGEAVGLHFAGRFLEANYAVPAAVVAARLEQPAAAETARAAVPAGRITIRLPPPAGVTHDDRTVERPPVRNRWSRACRPTTSGARATTRRFVGVDVPLPVVRNPSDVLTFPWNGAPGTGAEVPAFLGGDEPQPAALHFQRRQHRRQQPAPVQAAVVAPGSAHSRRVSRSETSATGTSRCSRAAT